MITLAQYFIRRKHTQEQENNAIDLLSKVNALLYEYQTETGNDCQENPHTDSLISGLTEGGFRLPGCVQGAALSSHKEAKGVDIYDPDESIDRWVTDEILEKHGLYREHPDSTIGWLHVSTRPPKSGARTFKP